MEKKKCILRTLHGETKSLHEKHVHQNRKKAWSVPCIGIENNITKNLCLECFHLLTYQNAKTHARHLFYRKKKRMALPKTSILRDFEIVT